jgi:hypothetical protein
MVWRPPRRRHQRGELCATPLSLGEGGHINEIMRNAQTGIVALFAVLNAGAAGCGSHTAGGDGSPDQADVGTPAPDAFVATDAAPSGAAEACRMLFQMQADFNARCYGGSSADWRTYLSGEKNCDTFVRHVNEGTAEYLADRWGACVQELSSACDNGAMTTCLYNVLHGKLRDGQPCADALECGSLAACFSVDGDACNPICVRFAHENEACGLYCGEATPCLDVGLCEWNAFCLGGTCVKERGVGQPCGGADQERCASTLYCQMTSSAATTGVCASRTRDGACNESQACPFDQVCVSGRCAPRPGLGQPCAPDPEGGCAFWTACDHASQKCVPAGRIGQPCAGSPNTPFPPLYCSEGTCQEGVCVALPSEGQACINGFCKDGLACDEDSCLRCP